MEQQTLFTTPESMRADFFAKLEKGKQITCPCCKRRAKVWRVKIAESHVRALATLYARSLTTGQKYIYWQDFIEGSYRGFSDVKHWGLITGMPKTEKQFHKRTSGYWRITEKGMAFISGRITLPKYAMIYNNECLGYRGPEVNAGDCVGIHFSFPEILRAHPLAPGELANT